MFAHRYFFTSGQTSTIFSHFLSLTLSMKWHTTTRHKKVRNEHCISWLLFHFLLVRRWSYFNTVDVISEIFRLKWRLFPTWQLINWHKAFAMFVKLTTSAQTCDFPQSWFYLIQFFFSLLRFSGLLLYYNIRYFDRQNMLKI